MKHKMKMLDPDSCESAIVTKFAKPQLKLGIGRKEWYIEADASVKLSDCHRWISWDMMKYDNNFIRDEGGGYNLKKIRNAINALIALEFEMTEAQKEYVKLDKLRKERNKAKKKKAKADRENDV